MSATYHFSSCQSTSGLLNSLWRHVLWIALGMRIALMMATSGIVGGTRTTRQARGASGYAGISKASNS